MDKDGQLFLKSLNKTHKLLNVYFTVDRLRKDFFGEESIILSDVVGDADKIVMMQFTPDDQMSIIKSRIIAGQGDSTLIIIEVAFGDYDRSSGVPVASKCFGDFRYNTELALTDVDFRELYFDTTG